MPRSGHLHDSHNLQIRGEHTRSPRDMFLFSMLQDGPRGLERVVEPVDEVVEEISTYGIDWDVADDSTLMTHLLHENPQDWSEHNPFAPGLDSLSHVPCDPPNSPFTDEQIASIDVQLAAEVDLASRNMHVRRLVWRRVIDLCMVFFASGSQ
ncbi:hypothetical protein B0H10DRAFT_1969829 [Mycena sp. CBHHK59/15]|nr:hypothetical protein B0H10DRAFT_1969829 [Mycena sp. CBHHK59/15]